MDVLNSFSHLQQKFVVDLVTIIGKKIQDS